MPIKTFATAVNCIDGRTQLPVIQYLRSQFGVDYVDLVTDPGPNKILSEGSDKLALESIQRRVAISTERHASKLIAVVGHHDCAGNPTEESEQKRQIVSAIARLQTWNFDAEIIGLWVDEQWRVSEVL